METVETTTTDKQLLLYHWVRIAKELYPNSRTENPDQKEFEALSRHLTLDEKLLFHDILNSITVINGHSRLNDNKQLISTHADFMNAMQLIMPVELRLTQKGINAYTKLQSIFKNKTFDYVQAGSRLKVSIKTVFRMFKPLVAHGLIHQLPTKPNEKALFQITEIESTTFDSTAHSTNENIFETMQGEWKDFVGFVEF